MIRISLLTLSLVMVLTSAASAQSVRRSGPADPRYYPDLYKGPGWGYTLSEYYTFGNKADGPYGYAIGGYRYGSNYDVQRWKEATGTDVQPGYYLQRWRERRAERLGIAPSTPSAAKPAREAIAKPQGRPTPALPETEEEIAQEEEDEEEVTEEPSVLEPQPADAKTSRRNATSRGLVGENSSQSSRFTGPEQTESKWRPVSKFQRIPQAQPSAVDDKNQ